MYCALSFSLLLILSGQFLSCSSLVHAAAAEGEQSAWLGYSLPPYSSDKPQALGELLIKVWENGTTSGSLSRWTPPPSPPATSGQVSAVRVGVLSGKAGSSGFAGNTVQVAGELLSDPDSLLKVHFDQRAQTIWAIGLSTTGESSSLLNSRNDGGSSGKTATKQEAIPSQPRVTVSSVDSRPPSPFVNKPVVLSKEGKVQEAPPEKTLFQKYWWVLLAITFVALSGGGGDGK